MDVEINKNTPIRPSNWRSERVIQLLSNPRHKPLPSDDHYVRSYHRFRLLQDAASESDLEGFEAFLKEPHSCLADRIYYQTDREFRHVLEACLLTQESFAEIGARLGMEEETVVHYAALFFSVRNRTHGPESMHDVILGPRQFLFAGLDGTMTDGQRAFLYRLFAYYGGPEALITVLQINHLRTIPEILGFMDEWLDAAGDQFAELWNAVVLENDRLCHGVILPLLQMAIEPYVASRKAKKGGRRLPRCDFERLITRFIANLSRISNPNPKTSKRNRRVLVDLNSACGRLSVPGRNK